MITDTTTTPAQKAADFQPGLFIMALRAMGGTVSRFGDMFALQFPETDDTSLLEMHSALSVKDRARLRSFLQSHFDGEA